MTKKKVSFVQVNFQMGPKSCNSFHLPYSVGCLWAYASSHDSIKENFQLEHIFWRRGSVEEVAHQLKDSHVVGFSTYIWNRNYNAGVAKRLRELNPNCVIIFGGPEPAISDPEIFKKNPWITAIIKNEGEITFKNVLENLDDLYSVPGLLINQDGAVKDTGDAERITDLSILPSPYLTGLFDHLIEQHPEVEWTATVETNRGCPYQCTFCDWGSLTYSKVKVFPMERVFAELEWASEKRVAFLSLADANFGIFPDRDPLIAEKFVELQNKHDFPYGFVTSFAKNQKKEVVDIIETLIKKSKNYNTGLMVSLQTLDENTLDIIKRKNLETNKIEQILKIARERDLPVGTELILGLPGETLQTWSRNIWKLLELNMHDGVDIYYSQMLENSELNQVQKQIYDIKAVEIYDYFSPSTDENVGEYAESILVTKQTADLPFEDMLKASILNWFIFTWHVGGLSDIVSRFLRRYLDVEYEKFYTDLFAELEQQAWYQDLKHNQEQMIIDWFDHGRVTKPNELGIKVYGNSIIFYTRQLLHARPEKREQWYVFLDQYLKKYQLDDQLHQELVRLQREQIIDMPNRDQYPVHSEYSYNLWNYVMKDQELKQGSFKLEYYYPEKAMSDSEYIDRLFWNRKRKFGRVWVNVL